MIDDSASFQDCGGILNFHKLHTLFIHYPYFNYTPSIQYLYSIFRESRGFLWQSSGEKQL